MGKIRVHRTLTRPGLTDGIDMLVRAPVATVPLAQLARAATLLSVDLRVVVYDTLYVALAVERALPFVTADRRLFDKMCASPTLRDLARWIGSADLDE
jgi:predicted nucleic acid-binding protein